MSRTKQTLCSIYFYEAKDLARVKQAAELRKTRPSVFMRDAVLAEAERVIARQKRRAKAA